MKNRFWLYLDLIRWNRPAGSLLLLWPSLSALWLASYQQHHAPPSLHLIAVFVLGTFLMRSSGCCFNDAADQAFDRHVKRTAHRPVTSGKLTRKEAVGVGMVLSLLAFALVLTTNFVTIMGSFAALALAVLYPFAKRVIAMPQAVLGIAFSFGIPMAFTAVQGQTSLLAWGLVLGNAFWVLAYDTQYAMVDREDDLKIGIKTSAITLGRFDVAAIMVFYALYLLIWNQLVAGESYGIRLTSPAIWQASLALACGQVVWHFFLIRQRTTSGCFRAFRVNHWLGLTLFAGLVLAL